MKKSDHDRVYPCRKCGVLRSKAEGGATFTVCDDCWDDAPNQREQWRELRERLASWGLGTPDDIKLSELQEIESAMKTLSKCCDGLSEEEIARFIGRAFDQLPDQNMPSRLDFVFISNNFKPHRYRQGWIHYWHVEQRWVDDQGDRAK